MHLIRLQKLLVGLLPTVAERFQQELGSRLRGLIDLSLEEAQEEEGQQPISEATLKGCLRFVALLHLSRLPHLQFLPSGDLYATWEAPAGVRFTARFLSERRVSYVVFTPDQRVSDKVERHSGICAQETAVDFFNQRGVRDFIT
jgi:hypothetical protein